MYMRVPYHMERSSVWSRKRTVSAWPTSEQLAAARSGNWDLDHDLVIARLDKLSRDDAVQAQLVQTDWDLIVCAEAHKLSATFFGGEVRYTKRYRLGQQLARLARHFLLLTATPHNGLTITHIDLLSVWPRASPRRATSSHAG
ncbi:MAG: DEAD/DEAH box helicase, partial [Candidatus Tectomicrobia bacterium]|nr:DEAD/DEAH box helicase [Candidatus Tectomicrobia bacterium]